MREDMSWDHAMCLSALLSRPAGSGWVALLLPSHHVPSSLGTASLGTVMPRQRAPGGDGSAATQGCSPGAGPVPGETLGLQPVSGCQQEGLATQAQEGSRDLASIPQAVRALLSQ